MKNKNLLILSLAAVTGLVTVGCSFSPASSSDVEEPTESIIQDEIETNDEVGTKVALRSGETATEEVALADGFGYQILDKTADTMSVRIIAAVDGFKGLTSASVISKVVTPRDAKDTAKEDEETIKEEQTFPVSEVYSSLKDAANIKWTKDVTFAKAYYIVYTLRNVPLAHYFDTITVTFKANSTVEASQSFTFNAQGIEGENTALTFEKVSEEGNEYKVKSTGSGFTRGSDLFVPASHYSVSDFYAVKDGAITTIANRCFSSTSVGDLVLPSTITTIEKYAFYLSSFTKLNIPENVVSMAEDAIYAYSYQKIGTLEYQAKKLVSDNTNAIYLNELVVSSGVESLPNKFFDSSFAPSSITYKGTETQWAALQTEANKNSGFFALDAVCSDTTYSTVTFHYGEGSLGETTGDVETTARNNRVVANPGSPYKEGQEFKGWFLDENGTEPFDFANTLISADFDLYAVYGEPGEGYSFDNPLEIGPSTGNSFTAQTYPGKEYEYLKLFLPEDATADWYYLNVDSDNTVVDETISDQYGGKSGTIQVFDSEKNEFASIKNYGISNTDKVQKITSTGGVRIYVEPGETYYIKAKISYTDSYKRYGAIAFNFNAFAQDSVAEAVILEKGVNATPVITNKSQKLIYKFTATETKKLLLNKTNISTVTPSDGPYMTLTIVDASAQGTVIATNSNTGSFYVDFDAVAGHTYYIELSSNDVSSKFDANKYATISIANPPAGFTRESAKAYELGTTATAENVVADKTNYTAGSYITFTLDTQKLVSLTTTGGSDSYKKIFEIYNEEGDVANSTGNTTYGMGSNFTNTEWLLEAGTYTAFVGYSGKGCGGNSYSGYYDTAVTTWADFKYTLKEVQAGDSKKLPLIISPTLDGLTSLSVSTSGKYYSFVATASNFLTIDTSALPNGVDARVEKDGTTVASPVRGSICLKTTEGETYLLVLKGVDTTVDVTFARADSVENGVSAETAFSLTLGEDDMMNVMSLVDSSRYSTVFFKYTAEETGVYKLFFQSFLTGKDGEDSYSGADTGITGVYGSPDTTTPLEAITKIDDDKGQHPETKGTASAYAEYAFVAGSTYYIQTSLPRLSASTFDDLKFGVAEKLPGSDSTVAFDKGEVDTTVSSLELDSSVKGTWNSFKVTESAKITFTAEALAAGTGSVALYETSNLKTPVATLTAGSTEGVTFNVPAGTTYYAVATKDADAGDSNLTLKFAYAEADPYVVETYGGTGNRDVNNDSVTTIQEGTGWSTYETLSDGTVVLGSGNYGLKTSKSVYKMSFNATGTVTFKWGCDSEKNYDYLGVYKNAYSSEDDCIVYSKNSTLATNGTNSYTLSDTVTVDVMAGDTLYFVFIKDGSGDKGLDRAFITLPVFTPSSAS